MLAASQTRDKEALTKEGVEKVLAALGEMGFEYILCLGITPKAVEDVVPMYI